LPLIDFSLALVSPFTCFIFKWISRILQQVPLYTQALITLLNFLRVKYPRRFFFLNKKINIIYIMILMLIFEGIVNIPNLFQYIKYQNNNNNNNTNVLSCAPSNTMAIVSNFTTSMLRSIIPAIFMIILDIFTIKILFLSKKKISKSLRKHKAFAIVLLILDSIFFLFNLPLSCTEILVATYQNILLYPSTNNTMALIYLLHAFANTIAYFYYLMPFFIHLVFNYWFRKELFIFIFRLKVERTNNLRAQSQTQTNLRPRQFQGSIAL